MEYDLSRFITAHERDYHRALTEIKNGRKVSHWMWYIFPQLKGLGRSSTSEYYGISDIEEAKAFLQNPILGAHLIEISSELLLLDTDNAEKVMGHPDDMKLRSSMTLFSAAMGQDGVFQNVLDKFFHGKKDSRTLRMLNSQY